MKVESWKLKVGSCELRVGSCELRVGSCELRVGSWTVFLFRTRMQIACERVQITNPTSAVPLHSTTEGTLCGTSRA